MAHLTAEDCLVRVSSQFDLTLIAAKRARQLARGAEAKIPWGNHKSTVLALQEIALGQITASILAEPDLPLVSRPTIDIEPLLHIEPLLP